MSITISEDQNTLTFGDNEYHAEEAVSEMECKECHLPHETGTCSGPYCGPVQRNDNKSCVWKLKEVKCAFCKAPAQHWHMTSNTPVCADCTKKKYPDDIMVLKGGE